MVAVMAGSEDMVNTHTHTHQLPHGAWGVSSGSSVPLTHRQIHGLLLDRRRRGGRDRLSPALSARRALLLRGHPVPDDRPARDESGPRRLLRRCQAVNASQPARRCGECKPPPGIRLPQWLPTSCLLPPAVARRPTHCAWWPSGVEPAGFADAQPNHRHRHCHRRRQGQRSPLPTQRAHVRASSLPRTAPSPPLYRSP